MLAQEVLRFPKELLYRLCWRERAALDVLLQEAATAEAIRKIAAAIEQPGGEQAVQLKVAERAVDAYSQLAKANNTMIVPGNMTEVSALIGSAMMLMKGGKHGG